MSDYTALFSLIKNRAPSLDISQNQPMAPHTSFKIGGSARLFARPENPDELKLLLESAVRSGVRVIVIGCGSNILFADHDIDALIIKTSRMSGLTADGETITAPAGAPLPAVSVFARNRELSGLEFAQGIPGSVGGGVTMNAGAYGFDISMICRRVDYISSKTLETGSFAGKELMFGYRKSVFLSNPELIVTSAILKLEQGDPGEIQAAMEDYARRRAASQPLDYPSAGSAFKRPEGYYAGRLIEECGLKGFRVGGACVSEKHAGFIVNKGSATCTDVLQLIEKIQEKVYCQFGVELECEIKHIK